MNHGSQLITQKERQTLYYIFLKYEEWKVSSRAFDFLDVVNHVLHHGGESYYSSSFDYSSKFDYLIIDEVQDLYPKTIKLLL